MVKALEEQVEEYTRMRIVIVTLDCDTSELDKRIEKMKQILETYNADV